MVLVLQIAEEEMTSGTDVVVEIFAFCKGKEILGCYCKLQKITPVSNTS